MSIWYSYDKTLSYNAILNFIIGERGVGKTYGATKYVINKFLKKSRKFVYLRRYKTELKESVPKFFDAIKTNNEFPNTNFEVKGNDFYINKKVCGYAFPLSVAHILKSSTFADVDTIIFDEFIIDKGCYHYLHNEVEQLLDIIETIGRLRDIRVFFLGNAISITNPYFIYFNLSLPYKSDIATFKDGAILVNYIKNESYREVKRKSRFGKLIDGTNYGKYAIDNQFLRDSKVFIKKRPKNSKFYFIIYYNGEGYGVWCDYNEGAIYFSNKYDSNCPIRFSFNTEDHNEKTILSRMRSSIFFQSILEHYRLGKLYFENQKIKNNLMDLLSKYLTY